MSIITVSRDLGLTAGIKSMWITDSRNLSAKFVALRVKNDKVHPCVQDGVIDYL